MEKNLTKRKKANMGKTCRTCEFFGGKNSDKDLKCFICLHPINQALKGGWVSDVNARCALYTKKHKEDKE